MLREHKMPIPSELNCVLSAEILGKQRLAEKLGQIEAQRAVDRARNRIMRSVEAHHGSALFDQGSRLVAAFRRADDALEAAAEMQEKVRRLPPVSGISLGLKIGMHCGELRNGELPEGVAVELAGRIAEYARPGQSLLSGELALHLSDALRPRVSALPDAGMRQEGGEIPLFELASQEGTEPAQGSEIAASAPRHRLVLRHRGVAHIVAEARPILLMGREEGNDIVVLDRRASRHHARIEWRQGAFFLVDQSSNGTFLRPEDESELMLKREEAALPEAGRIGCGFSVEEEGQGEEVSFEVRPI